MSEFLTKNQAETEVLAQKIAAHLKGGEILALAGNLGAGKTVMVKAIASALGVTQNITSPTFVLLKVYDLDKGAIKKLVHVDCYRLDGVEDLADIGLSDFLGQSDTIVLIEWADKILGLPQNTIKINIDYIEDNQRKINIDNLAL